MRARPPTIAGALGGRVVIKAQIPAGKRGKSGAIQFADDPAQARHAAANLLGKSINGFTVSAVLVEQALPIARELYAAVLNDPASKGPLVLFSVEGGMDIEEVNASAPEKVLRLPIDIRTGLSQADAAALLVRHRPDRCRAGRRRLCPDGSLRGVPAGRGRPG